MSATIKNAINSSTDYLHKIDLFNENGKPSRNMMLTTKLRTIDYELVNFSYPHGTLRLKMDGRSALDATHFIGPNFGIDNKNKFAHVYKITGLKTIGADVIEFEFEVDHLKDYMQQVSYFGGTYGSTPSPDINEAVILSSTDVDLWDRTLVRGDEPSDGTVSQHIIELKSSQNIHKWLVTGTISGHALASYLLDDADLLTLYNHLLSSEESEKEAGMIQRIEAVAYDSLFPGDGTHEAFTIEGNTILSDALRLNPYNSSLKHVVRYYAGYGLYSNDSIYTNGGEFAADAVMYIQGFGTIQLDYMLKKRLKDIAEAGRTFNIVVYENILTGVTTLEIDGIRLFDESYNTTMPIMSNAAPLAVRNYVDNQKMGAVKNSINGFASTLGIATSGKEGAGGNAAASVAGNAAGMVVNFVEGVIGYNNMLKAIGPRVGNGANGYLYPGIFIVSYKPNYRNIGVFYRYAGFPCSIMSTYITWKDKQRYLCKMQGAFKGADEWTKQCIAAIESGDIIYNYSEGYQA